MMVSMFVMYCSSLVAGVVLPPLVLLVVYLRRYCRLSFQLVHRPLPTAQTAPNMTHDAVASMRERKRARAQPFPHASYPQRAPTLIDRLQRLYPHPRDDYCKLDEKSHTYHVHGETYRRSVSSWVKQYFEEFEASATSMRIVERHVQFPGFRITACSESNIQALRSSVYNLALRLMILEKRTEQDFFKELTQVARAAVNEYISRDCNCPYSEECILEEGQRLVRGGLTKPLGPSCYYLMLLYARHAGCDDIATDLARTWEIYGNIESFKSTFYTKRLNSIFTRWCYPWKRRTNAGHP